MAATLELEKPFNMIQRALLRDLLLLRETADDRAATREARMTAGQRYTKTLSLLKSKAIRGQ